MNLFEAAEAAKQEALERVDCNADLAWKDTARQVLLETALLKDELTSEDVWQRLSSHDVETHEPRAMGAVMKWGAAQHVIEPTDRFVSGTAVSRHKAPIRVWRSLCTR